MHALIIHAHPEPTSFTAAMAATARRTLEAAGVDVEVSDLYAEGFNPVAGRHDFLSVADPARFHYQTEQKHAYENNDFAADLQREQARFENADLLVLAFPLWWGGMPAILKGWLDRVCAYGFAYVDGQRFEQGYFRGRRALLAVATGGPLDRFSEGNVYGPIDQLLYPIVHCGLEYMGLDVLPPFVAYAAPRVSEAEREAYLQAWSACVAAVAHDTAWRVARAKSRADEQLQPRRAAPPGNAWAMPR
jgi:NAD(P)H dehydrogenase (quinone)